MLDFQVAGRRVFQSPEGLLLILHVRSHSTQESRVVKSYAVLCSGTVRPWSLRAYLSLAVSVLREQALASGYANVQPPSG